MLVNLRDFPRCISSVSRSANVCVCVHMCVCEGREAGWSLNGGTVLLKCTVSEGLMLEKKGIEGASHPGPESTTPALCSSHLQLQLIYWDSWRVQKWPLKRKKKQNKLRYLKVPSGQRFTFKSNLWCCDLCMIHERGGRLWHSCNPMLQLCHRLPRF